MTGYLERLEQVPESEHWPLARSWILGEPHPFFAELRAYRPVLPLPELTLLARFEDCISVLRRHDAFTVALYKPKQGDYWMAQDDTPIHNREKSIMQAILDREQLPEIRGYVASETAKVLAAAGNEIDLVNGIARGIPLKLVRDWFGFADSDPAELQDWSYWNQYDAFHNQSFDSPTVPDPAHIVAKREAANLRMRDYIVALVQRRAGELKAGQELNDPVFRLLKLSFSGALRLDMTSVVLNVGGLLIGTVETSSRAIVNALAELLARPEQWAEARRAAAEENPASFDGYVFEALRFRPVFNYCFRVCERPSLVAGGTDYETEIEAGTVVMPLTLSAMFDPAVTPDPERFDPTRPLRNMFHFGQGLHECLGTAIATVMLPEIVRQCLRMPGLEAAGPIDYKDTPFPEHYPLKWRRAA